MTNPNLILISRHWPALVQAGLISVCRPASSYDARNYRPEARLRDLERRKRRYAELKGNKQ